MTGFQVDKYRYDLHVGGPGEYLGATVTPPEAVQKLIWFSLDESIVKVGDDGILTPVGVGSTRVAVSPSGGTGFQVLCEVNVYEQIAELSVSPTTMQLLAGGEGSVIISTVLPQSIERYQLDWTSDNEAVAQVTNTGYVMPLTPGQAVITATSRDGQKLTASCAVEVLPNPDIIPKNIIGDATEDGIVDHQDIASVAEYMINGNRCNNMVNANADLQGGIDLHDLTAIINIIVKGK